MVDCPGAKGLYTYRVPDDWTVSAGNIVSVYFGRQQVGAIAIRNVTQLPEGLLPSQIKPIESIINTALFTKEYWRVLNRVARYYQTPFIRVLRTALPPGLLSKSQRRVRLCKTEVISDTNAASNRLESRLKHSYPNHLLPEPVSDDLERDSHALIHQPNVSQLAQKMVDLLRKSPQGDYSWQYVRQQLKPFLSQQPVSALGHALQVLIGQGVVESYLAPPRSPSAQKRQAVLLLQNITGGGIGSVRGPRDGALAAAVPPNDGLSVRQKEILIGLEKQGGELWLSDALQLLHTTSKTLKKLGEQGYLVIEPREVLRAGSHSTALPDQPKQLTVDQSKALETLLAMEGYSEALLHGVTGSGKTEVYLQAIAPILAAQKSALVLVPEIGLTPQLTDRFRSRFGAQVCLYHSGLSEGERYDTWRQMLAGGPQIIIGTRSAIFAPLPNLGVIILDEEHDGSFKQDQPMPCYHARKVARWRAEVEECPLILGSATPSIETWVRFKSGQGKGPRHYLSLPQRVHARPLPPVEIIDMREELHRGNRTIFSRPLQLAIEELVEKGNQGILFIHRRGHSSFVSCRSCGFVMECPHCDVSLSFHQTHREATASLRCHYCGYSQRHPAKCPECASPYLKNFGSGTQRVVNDLAKYLPQARCIRFDSDTTRNKGAHRALLARFAAGEADLLVGTQMLTKGIDLPQVTLVGVIAADGLLFMPDYRASERAFQTMTQVAGRAGRGEQPGRVIVQTYSPGHVAIEALVEKQPAVAGNAGGGPRGEISAIASRGLPVNHKLPSHRGLIESFLDAELSDRAALGYPPYGRLVLLRVSGLDERASEQAAHAIATQLTMQLLPDEPAIAAGLEDAKAGIPALADATFANGVADEIDEPAQDPYNVMGPVPAPIFRVARRYRWHILLKLSLSAPLPDLSYLQRQTPKGVSLTIDVDPLNLS